MKSSILAISLVTATALGVYVYPTVSPSYAAPVIPVKPIVDRPSPVNPAAPININQKKIEVVFVLDTTGSMSGLIQAAKDNIWSIASSMASAIC